MSNVHACSVPPNQISFRILHRELVSRGRMNIITGSERCDVALVETRCERKNHFIRKSMLPHFSVSLWQLWRIYYSHKWNWAQTKMMSHPKLYIIANIPSESKHVFQSPFGIAAIKDQPINYSDDSHRKLIEQFPFTDSRLRLLAKLTQKQVKSRTN